MKIRRRGLVPVLLLSVVLAVAAGCGTPSVGGEASPPGPEFDSAFWSHWGDGQAEVASYDLTFPRYGAPRDGTAVAIFVTEPFSNRARVKADPGNHPDDDVFQVIKLNLVKDFPTGVYDYNTMLSAFVGTSAIGGRPAGSAAKVSFGSQEWCGHVYHQVTFDADAVRESLHSYFDGEADRDGTLPHPDGGISEDVLLLWARGLAGPSLAPGESRTVPVLGSLETARLRHRSLAWAEGRLARAETAITIEVPAGSFEVDRYTAAIDGGRTWTVDVERAAPHRVVRWATDDGESAVLVASERMPYWRLNGPDGREALERLGLAPRPPRTS